MDKLAKLVKLLALYLTLIRCCHAAFKLDLNASCPSAYCRVSDLRHTDMEPLVIANNSVPHLAELVLRDCDIPNIPVELFSLAPQLDGLIMHNCGINRIHIEDFEQAPQLRRLVLQSNNIRHLGTVPRFECLPHLELLELGHNAIQTVTNEAFVGLGNLTQLGLTSNGIVTLKDGAFAPLLNLIQLDLSDNSIDRLDENSFVNNSKLETLLLNGNRFGYVNSGTFEALPRLRLLDVSNCVGLYAVILHSVDTLLMEGSEVERLVIRGGVRRLLAGNNKLVDWILQIGDKSVVIELDLHSNLLKDVSALLDGMLHLQRLDLSRNSITALTATNASSFLLLPSLTHLNLAYNHLTVLGPDTLLLLDRLAFLDISFNHQVSITAETFAPLLSLERLYIEGNRLVKLDFRLLHLQNNRLKELGLCDNDWEFPFMNKMVTYLTNEGIILPARFVRKLDNADRPLTPDNVNELFASEAPAAQHISGVTGIHPYWTTRDVLAFVTLLAVFIIMLMQLYRILEDEGCLARCRRRATVNANGRRGTQRASNRPQLLNDEDSEQNSSE